VQLALDPTDHTKRLAKVDLSVTRCMAQRNKNFPHPPLLLANVIRDDGNPTGEPVFIPQPGMNTLGCVALLFDDPFVVFQDQINDRNERIQLRSNRWL